MIVVLCSYHLINSLPKQKKTGATKIALKSLLILTKSCAYSSESVLRYPQEDIIWIPKNGLIVARFNLLCLGNDLAVIKCFPSALVDKI